MLPSGILYSTKSIQRSAFMKRRYVPPLVPNSCAAVEIHGSVLNDAMPVFSIKPRGLCSPLRLDLLGTQVEHT